MSQKIPTKNIVIRRAIAKDAKELAALALQTFVDTYAADNDPSNMQTHCEQYFGETQQHAEIIDTTCAVLLAYADQELVGYALVTQSEAPDCIKNLINVETDKTICLKRFYVLKNWHGKGIASPLMKAILDISKSWNGQHLWLTMWEYNQRALSYYQKAGFTLAGETEFYFGTEIQKDFVFIKPLV